MPLEDTLREWALKVAREELAAGRLHPSDYVHVLGERVAYVTADGRLVEYEAKPGARDGSHR